MKFTLPYPPTVNMYWRRVGNKTLISAEGRAYKEAAGWAAKTQGVRIIETGDVEVVATFYRPRKRGDLDNCLKAALDSLTGIAYTDDSQIVRIVAERRDDAKNPRAELEIISLESSK